MHDADAYVWIDPGRLSGQPCVGGHGLSCEQMADCYWAGWSIAEMLSNWDLSRPQLLVAWWYQAKYGGRVWKKRWGAWAEASFGALWKGDYDAVENPPQQERRDG